MCDDENVKKKKRKKTEKDRGKEKKLSLNKIILSSIMRKMIMNVRV